MSNTIEERIQSWLDGPYDPETKDEIKRLQREDPKALSDAFFKDLSFGTGGMRALMGVGTNRLNIYTIQMATQGLANYILEQNTEKPVVFIGYDVRNHSREFAEHAARVFAGNGIRALLSDEICPTPLVSFACRYYKCQAAVMITASHNPPEYNGYKVYWEDGCQVVPPHDIGIIDEVKKVQSIADVRTSASIEKIDHEIDAAYLKELKKMQMLPELAKTPLKIIYSNLHGTGIRLVPKALESWGYKDVSLVAKQSSLDGNFPNAHSPNPEEEKAMALGMEQLESQKADLFLATDPDADRIGVAIKGHRLNGNETACICIDHICRTLKAKGEFPKNAAFIKSIVTTELFHAIALKHEGKCIDVLTGFKYIGELIGIWEKSFDGYQFIFGAEESYGYLFGTFVRDKDAISAACLIAEAAAQAKKQNLTLLDRLYEIYRKYGIYRSTLKNIAFGSGKEGMQKMQSLMENLRKNPPSKIDGKAIEKTLDFSEGIDHLPVSDVLMYLLEDKTKVVIRPSGTEPKVKIYTEVMQKAGKDLIEEIKSADIRAKKITDSFAEELHLN